ncbi:MAG: cellulase family glycosylhydrolase [Armatimonadetes bacterium]|nr:cellulase family glycosylhydrolase [Armatimonadota bacterium]MBS1726840.1 cellulase family glycosylhydrolase [Armatimonadota bacterium]
MMSLLLCSLAPLLFASPTQAKVPKLPPLHVKGNQILNDKGKPVILRGVNCASLEWSSDGEGHILDTVKVAVNDWKVNHIRLPLSQDRWFGKAPEQKDDGVAYRALVKQVVDWCSSNSCYVMLDMHWNNAGEWGKNIGQHQMPDMYTLDFWKDCAKTYRNNPAVFFDLYNEPHDVSWEIWRNGGTVEETKGPGARQGQFKPVTYQTPGMQGLLDAVRSVGARNLVIAGGLDWAYDLSGFLKGFQLKDSKGGQGVVYACHDYPIKGDSIEKYLEKLDAALPTIPIIMSEFGSENRGDKVNDPNPWVERMLKEWDTRKCNWTAWDLHPAAGPCLLQRGWEYKPSPSFGALVKANLASRPGL